MRFIQSSKEVNSRLSAPPPREFRQRSRISSVPLPARGRLGLAGLALAEAVDDRVVGLASTGGAVGASTELGQEVRALFAMPMLGRMLGGSSPAVPMKIARRSAIERNCALVSKRSGRPALWASFATSVAAAL